MQLHALLLFTVLHFTEGNLSLLISHLTEEDGGMYICDVEGSGFRDIGLMVKGCRLDTGLVQITAQSGGSVLLPCYCTDLLTKPDTLKWQKLDTWEEVSSERDQYRNRVQLGDGQHPGNLSLLITHLTENDSGVYKCELTGKDYRDLTLTVEDPPPSLPFVPFALVTVIFLHIVVAVVYCTTRKKAPDTATAIYSNVGEDGAVRLQ
ncbi:V-set and immunoglobulin domain-containing protein 1-like [Hoplias malabaricus]|uniref:V-set and immunoglobulin domain-containing protein 1-like n=1 Tax=Hoplias malabaricus TaxID=27720 RepID=UPI00346240C6